MSDLHKRVLELLGYAIKRQGYHDYDQQYINGYLLVRNGDFIRFSPCYAEEQAWAQAPSLDALMIPMGAALTKEITPVYIGDLYIHNGTLVCQKSDGETFTFTAVSEAVAFLFAAACEVGMIDGAAVVL